MDDFERSELRRRQASGRKRNPLTPGHRPYWWRPSRPTYQAYLDYMRQRMTEWRRRQGIKEYETRQPVPSAEQVQDRDARRAFVADTTASLMGDPPLSRSALAARTHDGA